MPALPAVLAIADQGHLKHLAQLWGIDEDGLANPQRASRILAAHMRSTFAARGVWEQMPPAARQCLWQIVGARTGVRRDLLPKKVKLSAAEVETALEWLLDALLVAEETPRVPTPLRRQTALSPAPDPAPRLVVFAECAEALELTGRELFAAGDRSTWTLTRLLDELSWDQLETLAARCGIHAASSRSRAAYGFPSPYAFHPPGLADMRKQVQQMLEESAVVFALLHYFPADAVRLWACLWTQEMGRATWRQMQAALSLGREALGALLPPLEAHALAFDTLTSEAERLVFLPASLFTQLQTAVSAWQEDEHGLAFLPLEQPPEQAESCDPVVLYDLAILVGWSQQHLLEITGNRPESPALLSRG